MSRNLPLALTLCSVLLALVGCQSVYDSGYSFGSATQRAAQTRSATERTPIEERKGLGTGMGEWRGSRVSSAHFARASSSPAARVAINYDDREGISAATSRDRRRASSFDLGPASIAITSGGSRSLTGYRDRGGNYVVGEHGDRYEILIKNRSYERIEVVVSVDGLDVMDGGGASTRKRGYVIPPRGKVAIEGWRSTSYNVRAFRFGSVADSARRQPRPKE